MGALAIGAVPKKDYLNDTANTIAAWQQQVGALTPEEVECLTLTAQELRAKGILPDSADFNTNAAQRVLTHLGIDF